MQGVIGRKLEEFIDVMDSSIERHYAETDPLFVYAQTVLSLVAAGVLMCVITLAMCFAFHSLGFKSDWFTVISLAAAAGIVTYAVLDVFTHAERNSRK